MFQITIWLDFEIDDEFDVIDLLYVLGLFSCFTASFAVSKKFGNSKIFGKAYLILGLAFASYLVGEIIYMYLDMVGETPYPAIQADLFYFMFYPLVTLYLIINIRFFKPTLSLKHKILLTLLFPTSVICYSYIAYSVDAINSFEYFYGLIFMIFASVPLSFSILGATIFNHTVLSSIWRLMALGIAISTIADIIYYSLEIIGGYDGTHPVNTLWMISYMIISYALYKHIKTF
ncbi:MAG: hypothetical protein KC444_00370 [Nitrosopumilus sp.]|nr:hypothetical protein [Nitrosopumilus sp.]